MGIQVVLSMARVSREMSLSTRVKKALFWMSETLVKDVNVLMADGRVRSRNVVS